MESLFSIKDCIISSLRRNRIVGPNLRFEHIMRIYKDVKSWGFDVHVTDLSPELKKLKFSFKNSEFQILSKYEKSYVNWFVAPSDKINQKILDAVLNDIWAARTNTTVAKTNIAPANSTAVNAVPRTNSADSAPNAALTNNLNTAQATATTNTSTTSTARVTNATILTNATKPVRASLNTTGVIRHRRTKNVSKAWLEACEAAVLSSKN